MFIPVNKIFFFLVFFILIFISAFENFSGVLSHYLIQYEYIDNGKIFGLNTWTEYVESSAQFLPLRIISFFGFKLNNDFFIFSIYFINGLIALFCLNKILLNQLNIKKFYERVIFIVCISSANFIIFKSVFSSIYNPYLNIQTSFTITLFYVLFYLTINEKYFLASLVSSLMIFFHLTVAWFPVLTFMIFFLYFKIKFKDYRFIYILIPISTFLFIYFYNFNVLNDQSKNSLSVVENIFRRSEEESSITLQPIIRIIFFLTSIPILYLINKKFITNYNLKFYTNLVIALSILTAFFGLFYTTIGYKIYPSVSLSYLYYVRAMMVYHIIFSIFITYYIYISNLSLLLKFSCFLSIYFLGKMMMSTKAIILTTLIVLLSLFLEYFFLRKNKRFNNFFSYKKISYLICFIFFISHIYLIQKNNLKTFDYWSFINFSDWTQHNKYFINLDNSYKDNLKSLRKCKDFKLLSIINKNNKITHDYYINFVTHKSTYIVDDGMLYFDYYQHFDNKNKAQNFDYLIHYLSSDNNIDMSKKYNDFDNLVLLIDYELYIENFHYSEIFRNNIVDFDEDFILFTKNKNLIKKILKCKNLK